jgi:hypothetical protein
MCTAAVLLFKLYAQATWTSVLPFLCHLYNQETPCLLFVAFQCCSQVNDRQHTLLRKDDVWALVYGSRRVVSQLSQRVMDIQWVKAALERYTSPGTR